MRTIYFFVAFIAATFSTSNAYAIEVLQIDPMVINGEVIDPSQTRYWPVVRIRTGNASCTGTVVGPNVLITAAHCGREGATSTFSFNGVDYRGKMTRSPIYPRQDHDIALVKFEPSWESVGIFGFIDQQGIPIPTDVEIIGYGCIRPGGGGTDGKLRKGETTFVRTSNYDMVTYRGDGAGLCYGDSGGPTVKIEKSELTLVGVNSKGNIRNRNYSVMLWKEKSTEFLNLFASDNNVAICGVNSSCKQGPPPPEPIVVEDEFFKILVEDKTQMHEVEFVRRHVEMLHMYLSGDESIIIEDGRGN